MQIDSWKIFRVEVGLGTDYDFMDRTARIGDSEWKRPGHAHQRQSVATSESSPTFSATSLPTRGYGSFNTLFRSYSAWIIAQRMIA